MPAQSLVAVGIGVIYLSLYAAHAFYALVGAPVAFVAMALATAVGFGTALRLDSRALAVLATLGGLLTPVILDTDTDAAAALFTYLAILDLGVLVLASRRGWPGLALLAFAGTQVLYWGWLDRWYQTARLPVALGWATVFFLAFAAWALRGSASERSAGTLRLGRALIILGAPALYFAAARRVLDDPSGRRLALLALALAAAYLVAARVAGRSARGGPRVALLHRALALAFLTLAPAVTLGRHDLVIAWSVEGLVLLLGGFALSVPGLRAGGLAISALAWGRWFEAVGENAGRAGTFLIAHPALPATVAVAVTAVLGALVYRARERAGATLGWWERFARPILLLVAIGSAGAPRDRGARPVPDARHSAAIRSRREVRRLDAGHDGPSGPGPARRDARPVRRRDRPAARARRGSPWRDGPLGPHPAVSPAGDREPALPGRLSPRGAHLALRPGGRVPAAPRRARPPAARRRELASARPSCCSGT